MTSTAYHLQIIMRVKSLDTSSELINWFDDYRQYSPGIQNRPTSTTSGRADISKTIDTEAANTIQFDTSTSKRYIDIFDISKHHYHTALLQFPCGVSGGPPLLLRHIFVNVNVNMSMLIWGL